MSSPCPNIEPTNFGWNIVLDPDLSSFHTGIPRIPVSHKKIKLGGHYLARRHQPNSKSSGKFPPGATGCHVQDVWCGVRGAPLAPLRHVNSRRIQWGNNRGTHPSETPQRNRKPASLLTTRHPSRSYMQIWKESRWVLIYYPLSSKRSWSLGFPGGGVRGFPQIDWVFGQQNPAPKKRRKVNILREAICFSLLHCKWCVLYLFSGSLKCMNASSESMYLTEPLSAFVGFGSLQGSLIVGHQTYLIQGHAWGTISAVSQYPDQSDTRFGIENKDNSTFLFKHQPSCLHQLEKSPTNM